MKKEKEPGLALYHPLADWLKGIVEAIKKEADLSDREKTIFLAAVFNWFSQLTGRPANGSELTRMGFGPSEQKQKGL